LRCRLFDIIQIASVKYCLNNRGAPRLKLMVSHFAFFMLLFNSCHRIRQYSYLRADILLLPRICPTSVRKRKSGLPEASNCDQSVTGPDATALTNLSLGTSSAHRDYGHRVLPCSLVKLFKQATCTPPSLPLTFIIPGT
jgi:hypothetical protein